jgi:hypothetical protein
MVMTVVTGRQLLYGYDGCYREAVAMDQIRWIQNLPLGYYGYDGRYQKAPAIDHTLIKNNLYICNYV